MDPMHHEGCIYIGDLSETHQRALRMFVAKYRRGAAEHGDLVLGRQWTMSMLEERVDENFYAIFQLLQMLDILSARGSRDNADTLHASSERPA